MKRFLLSIFIVLLVWPKSALALTIQDVEGKDDEALQAENWETRDVNIRTSSLNCGLWAILISPFWRGYGHHCIGDDASHYKLLGMEGASLVLLTSSLLMGTLSNDSKSLSGTWKSMFHFGATLFVASYLFDVLGAFKGNLFALDPNHRDPFGHSVEVRLRWLPSNDFNLGIQLDYKYRHPRFWINPYAYVDAIDLERWSGGVDAGAVLWHGQRRHTYIALAADASYEDNLAGEFTFFNVIPYVEFSLDLGTWFEHLAELRFVNRLGIGVDLYNFKPAKTSTPFRDYNTVLVLESELSINLLEDLNLAFIYRYRPDFHIGQISAPSRVFNTLMVPGVGIFSLDLDFAISNGFTANIEVNFGSSIDFWVGVAKDF